ncbi:MAG: 2-isopropylmalate synthase [Solirubrobacterales bacterium]
MTMPFHKYRPYPEVELQDRTWPDVRLTKAPIWTSVDLRDGNQALDPPMDVDRKRRMFDLLVNTVGMKEIEVGFPSSAEAEFEFMRLLANEELIPDDVTVMVLTQARAELIRKTFESLDGLPGAIVHLYNSTSTTQRRVVFGLNRDGVRDIAVEGAKLCRELAEQRPDQDIRFEYSPESFTATEPDYALEVCESVMDVFEPTPERKLILNLPATVELSTSNLYADVIEWFCRNVSRRDSVIISLHPHNDRGTAVAATELALMAGAERVEGTLFGNGERTGNVDLVTLALNLMTQGVDPELDFSRINEVRRDVEFCNRMPIGERHPYVGDLVYTAFSGSHQDAIKKGMEAMEKLPNPENAVWDVPYLPFDPEDIGRNYDEAVRVNAQSGKGGVAYIMRAEHDLELPRLLQIEFTRTVQKEVDASNAEITAEQLIKLFHAEYMEHRDAALLSHSVNSDDESHLSDLEATLRFRGELVSIEGTGNGTIAAFVAAIENLLDVKIKIRDYAQQTLSDGTDAKAISYVKLSIGDDTTWGVGEDTDTAKANFDAILSAVTRVPGAWDRLESGADGKSREVSSPLKIEFRRLVQPLRDQSAEAPAMKLVDYEVSRGEEAGKWSLKARIELEGSSAERIEGEGNGVIAAFVDGLEAWLKTSVEIREYAQQTLNEGTGAVAVSYVWVEAEDEAVWGMADHTDTVSANLNAVLSALGRIPRLRARALQASQLLS